MMRKFHVCKLIFIMENNIIFLWLLFLLHCCWKLRKIYDIKKWLTKRQLCVHIFHTILSRESLSPATHYTIYSALCSHIQQPLCTSPCYLIPWLNEIHNGILFYLQSPLHWIHHTMLMLVRRSLQSNWCQLTPAHLRTAATANSRKTHWLCT